MSPKKFGSNAYGLGSKVVTSGGFGFCWLGVISVPSVETRGRGSGVKV